MKNITVFLCLFFNTFSFGMAVGSQEESPAETKKGLYREMESKRLQNKGVIVTIERDKDCCPLHITGVDDPKKCLCQEDRARSKGTPLEEHRKCCRELAGNCCHKIRVWNGIIINEGDYDPSNRNSIDPRKRYRIEARRLLKEKIFCQKLTQEELDFALTSNLPTESYNQRRIVKNLFPKTSSTTQSTASQLAAAMAAEPPAKKRKQETIEEYVSNKEHLKAFEKYLSKTLGGTTYDQFIDFDPEAKKDLFDTFIAQQTAEARFQEELNRDLATLRTGTTIVKIASMDAHPCAIDRPRAPTPSSRPGHRPATRNVREPDDVFLDGVVPEDRGVVPAYHAQQDLHKPLTDAEKGQAVRLLNLRPDHELDFNDQDTIAMIRDAIQENLLNLNRDPVVPDSTISPETIKRRRLNPAAPGASNPPAPSTSIGSARAEPLELAKADDCLPLTDEEACIAAEMGWFDSGDSIGKIRRMLALKKAADTAPLTFSNPHDHSKNLTPEEIAFAKERNYALTFVELIKDEYALAQKKAEKEGISLAQACPPSLFPSRDDADAGKRLYDSATPEEKTTLTEFGITRDSPLAVIHEILMHTANQAFQDRKNQTLTPGQIAWAIANEINPDNAATWSFIRECCPATKENIPLTTTPIAALAAARATEAAREELLSTDLFSTLEERRQQQDRERHRRSATPEHGEND